MWHCFRCKSSSSTWSSATRRGISQSPRGLSLSGGSRIRSAKATRLVCARSENPSTRSRRFLLDMDGECVWAGDLPIWRSKLSSPRWNFISRRRGIWFVCLCRLSRPSKSSTTTSRCNTRWRPCTCRLDHWSLDLSKDRRRTYFY